MCGLHFCWLDGPAEELLQQLADQFPALPGAGDPITQMGKSMLSAQPARGSA